MIVEPLTPGIVSQLRDLAQRLRVLALDQQGRDRGSLPGAEPVANPLDRKELEWLKDEYEAILGRFSPDSRFLAYMANEEKVEVMQVYVRPFDPAKPEVKP
jgi:streptogramin lyase